MGAHALARGAAGGAGGVKEGRRTMILAGRLVLLVAAYVIFVWVLWRETPPG